MERINLSFPGNDGRASGMYLELNDFAYMIRELRKIDPKLVTSFRRNAREIAKPLDRAIKDHIPSSAPIKGMRKKVEPGRLTWNQGMSAKRTKIEVTTTMKKVRRGNRIVQVQVHSPATILADMSRHGGRTDGRKTREYMYNLFIGNGQYKRMTRRHRVNGQGKAMVRALASAPKGIRATTSRMVYHGAEKALPAVNAAMVVLVRDQERKITEALKGSTRK